MHIGYLLLCRCMSVDSSSHSESRQRLGSRAVWRRQTAGDVPHRSPLRSVTHSSGDLLRQRLWSEGNASSRRHSRLGTPRRTDSNSRLGMQKDALRLSELAHISLTGADLHLFPVASLLLLLQLNHLS